MGADWLFDTVHVDGYSKSWERLEELSRSEYGCKVKTIVWTALVLREQALDVIKWFTHHSRALAILQDCLVQRGSHRLTLILPVLTRWTSHYAACSRLLRLENDMRVLAIDYAEQLQLCGGDRLEMRNKAADILDIIRSVSFWNRLKV